MCQQSRALAFDHSSDSTVSTVVWFYLYLPVLYKPRASEVRHRSALLSYILECPVLLSLSQRQQHEHNADLYCTPVVCNSSKILGSNLKAAYCISSPTQEITEGEYYDDCHTETNSGARKRERNTGQKCKQTGVRARGREEQ
jgi:hypothetical protein